MGGKCSRGMQDISVLDVSVSQCHCPASTTSLWTPRVTPHKAEGMQPSVCKFQVGRGGSYQWGMERDRYYFSFSDFLVQH